MHKGLKCLLWGAGLLAIGLAASAWALRATPGWYQPLSPKDPHLSDWLLEAQGQAQALPVHAQGFQRGKLYSWELTQNQINSLLTYLAESAHPPAPSATGPAISKLPLRWSAPMVSLTPGQLRVAVGIADAPGYPDAIYSLDLGLHTFQDPQPMGQVVVEGFHAGYLPLPTWPIHRRMEKLKAKLTAARVAGYLEQIEKKSKAQSDAEVVSRILGDLLEEKPFPLSVKMRQRTIVVRELRVEQGRLRLVMGIE